jgi:hypothetical protein
MRKNRPAFRSIFSVNAGRYMELHEFVKIFPGKFNFTGVKFKILKF